MTSAEKYEYDIALSFAGEDREYVAQVTKILTERSVRVFYDKDEEAELWGENLFEYLDEVYRKKARFTIMFISKHYAEKLWTKHERKSAQARAFLQKSAYILPVRFDDTEIEGLLPTVMFIDLRPKSGSSETPKPEERKKTPVELCDLIMRRLDRAMQLDSPEFKPEESQQSSSVSDVSIVGSEESVEEWYARHREIALKGLSDAGFKGFMELRLRIIGSERSATPVALVSRAEASAVHTFGWPLGVVPPPGHEYHPKPRSNEVFMNAPFPECYDYWALRANGDFYLLKSLFEDKRDEKRSSIFFDVRVYRTTEAVLYAGRLYSDFGIEPTDRIRMGIRYGGIGGRILTAGDRGRAATISLAYSTIEDEIDLEIDFSHQDALGKHLTIVKRLCQPFFMVFDYFQLAHQIYDELVTSYIQGKI